MTQMEQNNTKQWPQDKATELRVMAAMALQGMIGLKREDPPLTPDVAKMYAEEAVMLAKALQAELDKEEQDKELNPKVRLELRVRGNEPRDEKEGRRFFKEHLSPGCNRAVVGQLYDTSMTNTGGYTFVGAVLSMETAKKIAKLIRADELYQDQP